MTRRFARLAVAPISLVMVCGTAMAQEAVIERCKQSSSDSDRIACLEAALLGKEAETAPESFAAVPIEPEEQADPPGIELDTSPADDSLESAAAAEAQPTGIGAEQVIANNQSKEDQKETRQEGLGMVIAKYEWVPYERLVVTFENGQVWRQIKGDTSRIRTSLERNQTADITESGFGGYMLRLNEMRRTIRVERIR
jgi:hypothetical protein